MDPADLSGFSGAAPLFPLPNVVFFPRTLLPLHIFEERYRAMMSDALGGERLIAMAMLKPGWEPTYDGAPEIFSTVGLGRIVQEQRLPDGRFNVVLLGLQRARVLGEDRSKPYRVGKLELLEEQVPPAGAGEQIRLGLLAIYATLARERDRAWKADAPMSIGLLCDLLAAQLEIEPIDRQQIFEELDVLARSRKVMELLRLSPASAKAMRSGLKAARDWPPDPNEN